MNRHGTKLYQIYYDVVYNETLTSIGWILVTVNGGTYLTFWRHSG